MYSCYGYRATLGRVSPFGIPRIEAFVQLPVAYRRLRVLHRLLIPRHSPCALGSFTKFCVYFGESTHYWVILLAIIKITVAQRLVGIQTVDQVLLCKIGYMHYYLFRVYIANGC